MAGGRGCIYRSMGSSRVDRDVGPMMLRSSCLIESRNCGFEQRQQLLDIFLRIWIKAGIGAGSVWPAWLKDKTLGTVEHPRHDQYSVVLIRMLDHLVTHE